METGTMYRLVAVFGDRTRDYAKVLNRLTRLRYHRFASELLQEAQIVL